MSTELREEADGKIIEVTATAKLTRGDYETFVPAVEGLVDRHGKIRVLFEMRDFHGWTAGALWEDLKFDLRHFSDIERLAVVGDRKWEKGMATFCRPFTTAEVRYFDRADIDKAREWIQSDVRVEHTT